LHHFRADDEYYGDNSGSSSSGSSSSDTTTPAKSEPKGFCPSGTDTSTQCIIDNDTNSWCIVTTPPMLKIGWEFDQSYSSESVDSESIDYWELRFRPYFEGYGYMQSILDLSEAYYNELTVELSDFMADIFMETRLYYDSTLCFGVGYECDTITFSVAFEMTF